MEKTNTNDSFVESMPDTARKAEEQSIDLSIIIPAYNEKDNVEPLIREIQSALDQLNKVYEVIFIDDGSTDGTKEELERCKNLFAFVNVIHFTQNHGQTAAMDAGFRSARGNIFVTCDADRQNNPADIPLLLDGLKQYDVMCGWRKIRNDSMIKKISSKIANSVRNFLTHETIKDTGCSLKAYKRECLNNIKLYEGFHRFLPTLIRIEGYSIGQVPVSHRPRIKGISKYSIRNRLFKGLKDLLVVRWMMKHNLRYKKHIHID